MERDCKLLFLIVYFVANGLHVVSAQTGPNVCYRRETYYGTQRVCAYRTWLSCCYYRYILKCYYRTVSSCCSGYRNVGSRCVPVCFGNTGRQGCNNVGNCVGPNTCSCDSGYSGSQCDNKVACSVTRPCYPGNCPNADNCQCSTGFGSQNCTTVNQPPIITLASAVLAYHHPMKLMDIYNYTTDATTVGTGRMGSASIWANFDRFNKIRGTVSASFGLETYLSAQPGYVTRSALGVATARMEWELNKLINGILTKAGGEQRPCTEVSESSPGVVLQQCQIEFTNTLSIDTGDEFKLTFEVYNGGYEILNGGIRLPFRQTDPSKAEVLYKIDLDNPTANLLSAFVVDEAFTKRPITTRWSGWVDSLSGMSSYNWEIFELQNKSGVQRYAQRSKANCINPQFGDVCNQFLDPIHSIKLNHDGRTQFNTMYEPKNPGVYAMVLEASDNANNSEYVARYVVFDPNSTIEIRTGDLDIKALSGSENASFKWQILSSPSVSTINLDWSWEGHFINRVQHEGGFLNSIEMYSPQLRDENANDNKFPKTVNEKYKEPNPNGRTRDEIPNKLGITRFDTYLDESGQQEVDINSGVSWTNRALNTTLTNAMSRSVSEGDFVTLWVRAEDKMGNRQVSSLKLGFDSSPPQIYEESFMTNMGTSYTYGSKLWFKTADSHSGISQLFFNIINKSNKSISANGTISVNSSKVERGFPSERYKVLETFYFYQHELEINNCWFRVPKERQESDRFAVAITAHNGAMLQSQSLIDVDLETFSGIGQYQAVKDIVLLENTGNAVRFAFNLTETCYIRKNIILEYDDGNPHRKLINPAAKRYDLLGLQPLSRYNVSFIVEYDEGDVSDPLFYAFSTVESQNVLSQTLSPAGLSGIIIAICLLLLFVVFILVMYKTGRLRKVQVVMAPIRNTIRRRREGAGAAGYHQYTTGGYDQEDIYMYGELAFEKEPDWHFRMESVTLDTLLKTGRFAMIYKASVYKNGKPKECVAKTLRDGYTDEDKVLMKAKINFFGTKVGEHPCVLGFIGAVTEEQSMGPIMLLEYCENGTLKDWLSDHQNSVSDDVIENLFRFSYDITRGMVYLASREIIHMRLAARNVFLNRSLSAKIAGFGPRQGDDDDESGKKERIPVKWLAPECLNKTGTASEKSDVWSYGVTIWEIFSIGATPYENVRSRDLPKWLKEGNRLSKPEYTDDLHYEIMKKCWTLGPSGRPTFKEINKQIESLFRQSSDDLYYYDSSQK